MLHSKILREKNSKSMIYVDFKGILVPKDNGKQNPDEPYTKIYYRHIACSYGYKLACVDDKFGKRSYHRKM